MSTGVQKGHEYKDYNRSTEGAGVLGVQVYEYRRCRSIRSTSI